MQCDAMQCWKIIILNSQYDFFRALFIASGHPTSAASRYFGHTEKSSILIVLVCHVVELFCQTSLEALDILEKTSEVLPKIVDYYCQALTLDQCLTIIM